MSESTIIREDAAEPTADTLENDAPMDAAPPMTFSEHPAQTETDATSDDPTHPPIHAMTQDPPQAPLQAMQRGREKSSTKPSAKSDAAEIPPSLDIAAPDGLLGPAEEIPDKLYFRIGEVARLAGIKPYVLRFWESEFSTLGPKKSGTGHRLYRRKDVQLVLEIKTLLYEKRFTIEGARKHLETRGKAEAPAASAAKASKAAAKKMPKAQVSFFDVPVSALDSVRKELHEILKLLQA